MRWAQFLQLHWEVLAATDFFTVEVATWQGLVTYYVLFVMELATRRVQMAGITPHPTSAFMQQGARQLTDPFDGCLLGKRYLLHDRDTKYTPALMDYAKRVAWSPCSCRHGVRISTRPVNDSCALSKRKRSSRCSCWARGH